MTAPERIWATCNGSDPSGNWWHCRELAVGVEYILVSHVADMVRQREDEMLEWLYKVAHPSWAQSPRSMYINYRDRVRKERVND